MIQEIEFKEIRGIVEAALLAKYREDGKLSITSYLLNKSEHTCKLNTLWEKPGVGHSRCLLLELDSRTVEVRELTPEGTKLIIATPEQRLLELLEEGISMGKFNAIKAQRAVWDDFTSR